MLNDEAGNDKAITATGVFTDEADMLDFLDTLNESELGKKRHHEAPMKKEVEGAVAKIILHIQAHAVFLMKYSLNRGMLRQWGHKFTITDFVECN
ncbi:MAG: hypothetical protein A2747_00495 [Candidatus Yonathbacteria bacterium RIFCSPHIGHO2_01_FULL_44_41]|uniref:Uncharacterized protein n=1 Tax=Candidatus Yonathbacteria bacterium RIFCSPHIGHO2_02_FULL_44_14 TaxID=1802724 RepID=A0A1G2SAC0_9BACT|nr:MAG: hypothetical protein A2747_00495 [Candidatus Yonathbacteria bacterium RIFCSPHIGHO2_01_FULL_44_41]OHA80773.1 MAG: hypothetical protein A3B06_02860 [Candidatus Yonathbacteria bacterium RIFCSPLOWO2_01_FULL_43_20]OHA82006.1 MAG: hypothetical protein A3D51_00015 [Candidatus Yonathbacteria bacterium RIFCSPHIGHO2_02_FULL_44_14]